MSTAKAALNPFLLCYRDRSLEEAFRSSQSDQFSKHLLTVVLVLVAMNIARIVLYSTESTSEAEIGWSVSLLVVSLGLPCLLWVRKLKFIVVAAAVVVLYLTCVEWIVSFEGFFGYEVRAIIVALAMVNVYIGLFLFAWGWVVFLPGMALGTIYLILRTNLYFEEQDVPSQLFTGFLPLVIVYLHQKSFRTTYLERQTAQAEAEKWRDLLTALPSNVVVLDLQNVLYVNPAASEFLQVQELSHIYDTLKAAKRKDNSQRTLGEDWKELLDPPTSGGLDVASSRDILYTLAREEGAHQLLQVACRVIPWERGLKAVAVTFNNVTKAANHQAQEARTEVAAMMAACAHDLVKSGLIHTSGELKLKRNPDSQTTTQLLGAYYGVYCIEDLHKALTGSELRLQFKAVLLQNEMTKIQAIIQPLFDQFRLPLFTFVLDEVPGTVKLDTLRYRQLLCLLLTVVVPRAQARSSIHLTVSPKANQPSNELLLTLQWQQDKEKPLGVLFQVAEKLAKKLGTEGLSCEQGRVKYSFFAGFVMERRTSDVSLDVPGDEANKGVMPPENPYGLLGKR